MKPLSRNKRKTDAPDKPRAGRPRALQREEIVRAALEIIYDKGHEALSMRALAARLDTGAATLYNYFPSQRDVEEAIVDRMLGDIPVPDPTPGSARGPLRAQLVEMSLAYRDLIVAHPHFDAIAARTTGVAALRLLNATLRVLVDAGVPIERAGLSYAMLRAIAHQQALVLRQTRAARAQDTRRRWVREMPPGDIDMVLRYLDSPLFSGSADDVFRRSVETLLDALMPELSGGRRPKR